MNILFWPFHLAMLPFRIFGKIIGLITTVFSLLMLGLLIWVASHWFGADIPDNIQSYGNFSAAATECMVKRAWSDLTPESKKLLEGSANPDLAALAGDQVETVLRYSTDCLLSK